MKHWLRQGGTLLGYSALVAMARAVPEVSEERFAAALDRLAHPLWATDLSGGPPIAVGRHLPERLR